LCRREDRIVGQQGGIPVALKADGRIVDASWAIDLMVDPAWRLRGVAPALFEAYAADHEALLALGLTDVAYRNFKRAGWQDLGTLSFYVRILDPRAGLEVTGRNSMAMRLAARAGQPALHAANAAIGQIPAVFGGVRSRRIDHFDDTMDHLWAKASPAYPAIAVRDAAALTWRFDQNPMARDYHRVLLEKNGEPCGYFVLSLRRRNGHLVAILLDFLATPRDLKFVLAAAVDHGRSLGVAVLYTWMLNDWAERSLKWLGFVRVTGQEASARSIRFMALPPAGSGLADILGNRSNWFVTYADSDIAVV
jgi:GNAT superfamily N-acetyltransferase